MGHEHWWGTLRVTGAPASCLLSSGCQIEVQRVSTCVPDCPGVDPRPRDMGRDQEEPSGEPSGRGTAGPKAKGGLHKADSRKPGVPQK